MTRARGIVAGTLFALVLVLVVAMQYLDGPAQGVPGSAASPAPDGRKALALLLADVGFDAQPWRESPAALPRRPALLWLARPPRALDKGEQPTPARLRTPPAIGAHSLDHYRRFVESGGALLLPHTDDARTFLVNAFGDDVADAFATTEGLPGQVQQVRVATGEVLEIEAGDSAGFLESALPAEARVVATAERADGTETPIVVALAFGSGSIACAWTDGFLANETIGARDHAVLAVRLAEALAPGERVLFDEYALGLWSPSGVSSVALGPTLFLATAHALLLLLAIAWFHAAPRAFPRDPEPLDLASPLLRVRARAALLERAGRHDLLAALLRRGVASRLASGFATRARPEQSSGPAGRGEGADPLSDEAGRGPAPIGERELAEIAARTGADVDSVRELFASRDVGDAEGLDALACDLALLERKTRARR